VSEDFPDEDDGGSWNGAREAESGPRGSGVRNGLAWDRASAGPGTSRSGRVTSLKGATTGSRMVPGRSGGRRWVGVEAGCSPCMAGQARARYLLPLAALARQAGDLLRPAGCGQADSPQAEITIALGDWGRTATSASLSPLLALRAERASEALGRGASRPGPDRSNPCEARVQKPLQAKPEAGRGIDESVHHGMRRCSFRIGRARPRQLPGGDLTRTDTTEGRSSVHCGTIWWKTGGWSGSEAAAATLAGRRRAATADGHSTASLKLAASQRGRLAGRLIFTCRAGDSAGRPISPPTGR
jgi:hypothetical protein